MHDSSDLCLRQRPASPIGYAWLHGKNTWFVQQRIAWGIACAVRASVQARQNRGPSNIRHEAQEHETLMQGIVCFDDNLHEASAPALRPDGSLLWGTLGACWDQTVRRLLNAAGHLPQQDTLLCCVIS